jgi:hypothetical protein
MAVKFTTGVPNSVPAFGQEIIRTDSKGGKRMLTGFDHNMEIKRRQIAMQLALDPMVRADAAGLALEEDMRHRKTQFWETPQRQLAAEQFLPMDPEAGSYANAEEYAWELRSRFGKAEMHASLNGITEAPDVMENGVWHKVPIYNAVVSYGWSVQDEMVGGRIGYNFGTRRAQLARDEIADAFDRFLLVGGSFAGLDVKGLFNSAAITPVTGATGDWYTVGTTTTEDEIFADFRLLYDAWRDANHNAGSLNSLEMPDTVVFSDRIESLLRHTPVDPNGTNRMSILEELKARYPEVTSWLTHSDLRDVDSTGDLDRVLLYKKDARVLQGAIPVAYQERPMIVEPFGQRVYAYGRVAPVEIHNVALVQYLDVAMHA